MIDTRPIAAIVLACLAGLAPIGCASNAPERTAEAPTPADGTSTEPDPNAPPPNIRAWMDRLTVEHEYDPKTGFIVARRTVTLPPLLAEAPPLDEAVRRARAGDRLVIAFATADRCAPCQQYKLDALNDERVIARLAAAPVVPTHVEVDRQGELADTYLGGRAIPMTYALRDGRTVAALRGQRSADDLLDWLDQVLGD